MDDSNSGTKRGHITIPSGPDKRFPRNSGETRGVTKVARRRRRNRVLSLDAEIRQSARQIYEQGFADAMKAAALLIVSRKLDEVRALLVTAGMSAAPIQNVGPVIPAVMPAPAPVAPAPIKNPCVQCGRAGVYRSKPSQWNRTGSWFCRVHMVLGMEVEAEDRMDRAIQPPPAAPAPPPSPELAAGASSLAEAMGLAQVIEDA